MTWYAPISGTASLSSSGAGDGVFIAPNVIISTTSANAISLSGIGCEADIYGTVVSTLSSSLVLGTSYNQQGHTVQVHEDAFIRSFSFSSLALYGYGNDLVNEGHIMGITSGLQISGENASTSSHVVNSGTISNASGIYGAIFLNRTETLILDNSGIISNTGTAGSFLDYSGSVNEITNTGLMTGDIWLGGEADLYDGRNGKVIGTVHGGAGNDRITGGKEKNVLDGGADDDILTGGKGNDTFVFANGYGKDRITDFGSGKDRIDVSGWAAIDSFSGVKSHARNHGDDVWIKADSDVLIIEHTHKADLHAGDFIF